MRAVIVREFGSPTSFRIEEVPEPDPAPHEVRVRVHAAAANFVDALVSSGDYQVRPALPYIPGAEFSGVIDRVGADVNGLEPGDRVCGSQVSGAYGEQTAASSSMVFRIPDSMSFAEAAIFRASNGTAYHALVQRAKLHPGETVLVLGAAGGVGYSAVQIAKALGAHVIACASTEEKRAVALAAGADAAIASTVEGWRDRLKAALDDRPLDVVVDTVGGELTDAAFRSLGWGGRHLVIGFASGAIPSIRANLALVKGIALVGVDFRQFNLIEPGTAVANMAALLDLYRAGHLPAPAIKIYPAGEFAQALADARSGAVLGRRVIDFSLWPDA
jgi:NADPH2:quinone reductase